MLARPVIQTSLIAHAITADFARSLKAQTHGGSARAVEGVEDVGIFGEELLGALAPVELLRRPRLFHYIAYLREVSRRSHVSQASGVCPAPCGGTNAGALFCARVWQVVARMPYERKKALMCCLCTLDLAVFGRVARSSWVVRLRRWWAAGRKQWQQ